MPQKMYATRVLGTQAGLPRVTRGHVCEISVRGRSHTHAMFTSLHGCRADAPFHALAHIARSSGEEVSDLG